MKPTPINQANGQLLVWAMAAVLLFQALTLGCMLVMTKRLTLTKKAATEAQARASERFSNVAQVLRYLLDNSKAEGGAPTVHLADLQTPQTSSQGPELEFLRVHAEKLNLRRGPGESYPVVMSLSAGTSLVADKRQDTWCRVGIPRTRQRIEIRKWG
jgi:hypothetical protein